MASKQSRRILLGAVLASTLLVVVVVLLIACLGGSVANPRFKEHIQEYLAIPKEQLEQGAYVKGKLVAISVREKEVDEEVFPAIPDGLRAAGPEEVGTVVLLQWGTKFAGFYQGPNGIQGTGDVQTCEVTVIDKSIPAVVGRRGFSGGLPALSGSGYRKGPRPIKEVVDYLAKLPREASGEGPPPRTWTVLFRSDDPTVWNTDSPGAKFAIPVRRAHSAIRFVRCKRLDTGDALIAPIKRAQLARENRPNPTEGYWWNGTAEEHWGARHLGLAQVPPAPTGQQGMIGVSAHHFELFAGSGFGLKKGAEGKQSYCWQGKEIPRTVFEIAVTAGPLTEGEKRSLTIRDADAGAPPQGWTVLFRSDDPADWNTFNPGAKFALPVIRAHSAIRHLRLKRLDTGEFLVLPIAPKQLLHDRRPQPAAAAWWNGTARIAWGARHLGIVQAPVAPERGVIGLANVQGAIFRGSGFGWKTHVDDKQYYCWQGQEIPRTAFEIAVTADPLTEAEKRCLATSAAPLPLARQPLGTPIAKALAQPEPPQGVAGKKTVDLIPLIDQSKDVVRGRWVIVDKALHCNDEGGVLCMQIPYSPPEEYDFTVTFSQPRLRNGVSLVVPNPRGGSFFWAVAAQAGWRFGLHGKPSQGGAFPGGMAPNRAYTTTLQVRRDGVTALLDGKILVSHKTDFRDLTSDEYRAIPNTKLLAVACDDPTVFHYLRVVEITGNGKQTR